MPGLSTLFMVLLIVVAVFLILVVLVQRGRGGGLAGALGGMGGQSAFGTKAGDTFTKITIWTAAVWILLCVVGVMYLNGAASREQLAAPTDKNQIRVEADGDTKGPAAAPRNRTTPEKGGATAPKETAPPPPAPATSKDGKNP